MLRVGLPRSFTDPWDAWLLSCLPRSRQHLGEDWALCWLEAPVWRFALAPGLCGPQAVLGVWVASVDHVGRGFPLTVAALADDPAHLHDAASAWLDLAEAAACDAVLDAAEPEMLAVALSRPELAPAARGAGGLDRRRREPTMRRDHEARAVWWTRGAPWVPPMRLSTSTLPGPATFTGMLHASEGSGA